MGRGRGPKATKLWENPIAEAPKIDRTVFHLGELQIQCANQDRPDYFFNKNFQVEKTENLVSENVGKIV